MNKKGYSLTLVVDLNEPLPDIVKCSDCGKRYKTENCIIEEDGDWETGFYKIYLCPVCEDGGYVEDYYFSRKQYRRYKKWKKQIKKEEK